MDKVVCFNRDGEGRCMAYTKAQCSEGCQARIIRIEDKINLLSSLIRKTQARKDQKRLQKEMEEALKVKKAMKEKKLEGWMSCYWGDTHRGEKGGASESDSNRRTGLKQLMKDNRPVGVKPTQSQLAEYKEELTKWEEENEKLERLGRTGMTHSKMDSYTGQIYCFIDDGFGTCRGMRSSAGDLISDCKKCEHLREDKK